MAIESTPCANGANTHAEPLDCQQQRVQLTFTPISNDRGVSKVRSINKENQKNICSKFLFRSRKNEPFNTTHEITVIEALQAPREQSK